MAAPMLFIMLSTPEQREVIVVDHTGSLIDRLHGNEEVKFVAATESVDSLRANEDNDAILVIGSNAVQSPRQSITLFTRGSISMTTDSYITSQLKEAIEDVRLENYNIPNIKEIISDVNADVDMATVRIDTEEDTATSSELSYFIALALDMLLYMFILIYGQQVMTSIIEEKNNRVLEIMVSSVSPFKLMLGKIVGIGLVAVTQILIWSALMGSASAFIVPAIMPASEAAAGTSDILAVVTQLGNPGYVLTLFLYVTLFFIGGFLFYSSIFAAIGSAVSNIQDAGQLSSVATMPIIIAVVGSLAVINDPGSQLALWISIIPFTSPMGMMARLPFGVAGWEISVSLIVLYASFILMIWICAKIYRVGIFMYGKKPTLIDVIKWAKEK